jgi:hypothetical protein
MIHIYMEMSVYSYLFFFYWLHYRLYSVKSKSHTIWREAREHRLYSDFTHLFIYDYIVKYTVSAINKTPRMQGQPLASQRFSGMPSSDSRTPTPPCPQCIAILNKQTYRLFVHTTLPLTFTPFQFTVISCSLASNNSGVFSGRWRVHLHSPPHPFRFLSILLSPYHV